MTDHKSNFPSAVAGSNFSRNVQLHVIRLTLKHLDQQLATMRESGDDSVVEAVIDKSRASTFIREVVERELKKRNEEQQLFARVERMAEALHAADDR